MSFEGTVINGTIVLNDGMELPEGARVIVREACDIPLEEPAVVDMSPVDFAPKEPASSAQANGLG